MTKLQRVGGYIYLPLHILILPLLVGMLVVFFPNQADELTANIVYFGIGFLVMIIFERKYLRNAFDRLLDNKLRNAIALIIAFAIYFIFSLLVNGMLLLAFGDEMLSNPNNEEIGQIAEGNFGAIVGLAVFLGPVVEEVLFRGVVFGALREKHRTAAFIVSIVLFAVCHVWQYAVVSMDPMILVFAIQYFAVGYALAWLYENTGCIWMPIFMHMIINAVSMSVL